MKIVATDIPKTIEDYQIALNAAFEGGKAYGAAAEREACAKVCEGRIGGAVQTNEWWNGFKSAMKQCAAAIRARGEK